MEVDDAVAEDTVTKPESENSEQVEPDAMYKFINGEITFHDYLDRMDQDESSEAKQVAAPKDKDSPKTTSDDEMSESLDDSELNLLLSESEDSETEKKPKKLVKKKRIQRTQLSRTLQAVMGQANVCYAKGDTETAVKMCLEIIKEEPRASEPFRTLANIYEEIGKSEKALQMRLIAAHLGPVDKEEWLDLANILKKNKQFRNAVVCLTKAIGLDELNVSLYEERAELLKVARMSRKEDYGYHRLLSKLDPKQHAESVVHVRRKVAGMYYDDGKYEKAYSTLKYVFENCAQTVVDDDVKFFVCILVEAQKYSECLEVLRKYCDIDLEAEAVGDSIKVTKCNIPGKTSVDIQEKLIITLCHLDSFDIVKPLVDEFVKVNTEVVGDLFFNIATILAEKEQYEYAVKVLIPLSKCKSFNSTKLWFKLAHCYKKLNMPEECRQCYQTALGSFPDDDEIKLKFCNELKAAGMLREAIDITKDSKLSLLIYERCKLYEKLKEPDGFIESALELFRLHYKEIKTNEDFNFFQTLFPPPRNIKDKMMQRVPVHFDTAVTVEEEWDIFLKTTKIYIDRKDYDLLQQLTFSLYLSFKFMPMRKELQVAMLMACILNGWWDFGYDISKNLLIQYEKKSERAWNIFNIATSKSEYTRLHKFLTRFLLRNPNEDNALMLYANCTLISGSYKYALNDYTLLYDKYKTSLLALLVALSMLHIACQKFTKNKHTLVAQMIAFLTKYEKLRGCEASQEVFYNIGRAFHQLALFPQAIYYYKKALSSKPPIEGPMFDLQCDIAFNLHLIYLNSGQPLLANMYLQKYIVI